MTDGETVELSSSTPFAEDAAVLGFMRLCEGHRKMGALRGWAVTRSPRGWKVMTVNRHGQRYEFEEKDLGLAIMKVGDAMQKDALAALGLSSDGNERREEKESN